MPKCKGCGQEITWIEMATGKKMPVDAKPILMVQVKGGVGQVVTFYRPHWATCKRAKDFKGKEKV